MTKKMVNKHVNKVCERLLTGNRRPSPVPRSPHGGRGWPPIPGQKRYAPLPGCGHTFLSDDLRQHKFFSDCAVEKVAAVGPWFAVI